MYVEAMERDRRLADFGHRRVASARPPTPEVKVPDNLKAGEGESLAMSVHANGVQIYECRARRDQAGGYEWAFVAPEADLLDARADRRPPLRGSSLGVDRRQQGSGCGEGSRRRAGWDPLAAALCEVGRAGGGIQPGHEHTAGEDGRGPGPEERLLPGDGRDAGPRRVHGGLLFLHHEVRRDTESGR